MTFDVLLVNAERGCDRVLYGLWILRRGVDDDFAVFELSHGCRRFHRRVRKVRHVVLSFVSLAALGELGVYVAHIARGLLRFPNGFEQRLLVSRRVVACVFAGVPLYLERFAAFHCGPGVVGDYRHAAERLKTMRRLEARDNDGLLNTGHLARFLIVEALELAAENGRSLD